MAQAAEAMFKEMDTDGNGALDTSEVRVSLLLRPQTPLELSLLCCVCLTAVCL